ncbi:MAG: tRNA lysidine(34) synthetase TilS [Pseudomonadota bacterium]|nr:tRNA lysidine(34) synthetase TilS [Pseudomonadota bacterium]
MSETPKIPPVSIEEFSTILKDLVSGRPRSVAVALSGGSDSMALAWLLNLWCNIHSVKLVPLMVDHQLRPNSNDETIKVSGWLNNWGLNLVTLSWVGDKPSTSIQESARKARYDLMLSWCKTNRVQDLFLAHNLGDQAETLLMRVIRGSGVNGLACMLPITSSNSIRLIRPFLGIEKERLQKTLQQSNQGWIEDPSNVDPRYTRTTMRALTNALSHSGISPNRLGGLAKNFGRLRIKLDEITSVAVTSGADIYQSGWARISSKFLFELPDEIEKRVVLYLLKVVGGKYYPPRVERLLKVIKSLKAPIAPKAATIGGCVLDTSEGQTIIFRREEFSNTPLTQVYGAGCLIWRGVFRCVFDSVSVKSGQNMFLAPLGMNGWLDINKKTKKNIETTIPFSVILTLPTLFFDGEVVAVPHLGYERQQVIGGEESFSIRFLSVSLLAVHQR